MHCFVLCMLWAVCRNAAAVTGHCAMPSVGAGRGPQVLCKAVCSYPLSNFSSRALDSSLQKPSTLFSQSRHSLESIQERWNILCKSICIVLFTVTVFIIAQTWKQNDVQGMEKGTGVPHSSILVSDRREDSMEPKGCLTFRT